MNSKRQSHKKALKEGSSQHSKAFDECILALLDEIELAVEWKRPSILLVVHESTAGQRKAEETLEDRLMHRSKQIIHVATNNVQPGLFQAIEDSGEDDQPVYFVDGLGKDPANYQALNLKREYLVEKRVIVVFWLLKAEAAQLPRLAPDFWAFRHRVIEFAPSLGARHKFVPSGLLSWHPEYFQLEPLALEERIAYQEAVVADLPSAREAVLLRAEAVELLASHYWLSGEHERAEGLLREGLGFLVPLHMPEQEAKFLNGLAVNAFDQEQYETADRDLEHCLKLDPESEILVANFGIIEYARGQTARSIRTIEKAIRKHPASAELPYVLGYIHLLAGNVDAARSCFEKTTQLHQEHFSAHCATALCYSMTGTPDVAARILGQLEAKDGPSNAYRSICIAALKGDQPAAVEKLRFALANRTVSPYLVKRDPMLYLLFGRTTLDPVV